MIRSGTIQQKLVGVGAMSNDSFDVKITGIYQKSGDLNRFLIHQEKSMKQNNELPGDWCTPMPTNNSPFNVSSNSTDSNL